MIRVPLHPETFTKDQKTWWDNWSVDAETAITKAIEAWEKDGTNLPGDNTESEVWSRLKR